MRATLGIAVSVIVAAAGMFAFSHRDTPSLGPRQIPVDNMNLTSITQTDAGLVTAGELGHILMSSDKGATWQKAALSDQRHALITRMHFKDDMTGLAIGHEGWILKTRDGGAPGRRSPSIPAASLCWAFTCCPPATGSPLALSGARSFLGMMASAGLSCPHPRAPTGT